MADWLLQTYRLKAGYGEAVVIHDVSLRLGEGQTTDLLALGLSATNALEHAYGNSGPEMLDQIRRLDRRLGLDGGAGPGRP